MNCRDATALASRGMDTRLGLADRLRLWRHLGACRHCRRFQRQMKLLGAYASAHRRAVDAPPPDDASDPPLA